MKTKAKYFHRPLRRRDGISIIEVLTSLAVATIGVFGVLVLIPFAVKQAQIGLDQDAADLIGRNAIEDLQTYGYTSVTDTGQLALRGSKVLVTSRTFDGDGEIISEVVSPVPPLEVLGVNPLGVASNFFPVSLPNGGLNTANPRIIHFDPVAVGNVGFPTPGNLLNPDFLTGQLPAADTPDRQWNDLRVTVATGICRTTFTLPGPQTFHHLLDIAEVNRMFRTEDDLIIGDRNFLLPQTTEDIQAKSEIDLPQPVYDVSTGGNLMKRQTNGRISWSAIFVPIKDGNRVKEVAAGFTSFTAAPTVATKYKVYVLVYKDRSVISGDPESIMNVAVVNRHTSQLEFSGNPTPTNTNVGYTDAMDQLNLLSPSGGVFKDDWVMVINRKPAPEYGATADLGLSIINPHSGERLAADEAGYDVQIGFAKVLSVISDATTSRLNVAGGPFNFYYRDIRGTSGRDEPNDGLGGTGDDNYGFDIAGDPDEDFTTETYVIHLKNVISVLERTITLERDSSWN